MGPLRHAKEAGAIVCLAVASAFAQTGTTIVVTAPRLDDLDLMDTTSAADSTTIDREAIESSGASSVPELLQKKANLLMRAATNSRDGQPAMRGFGDNSHLRVLVLVDGHPASRPDMAGTDWQSIPLENVEQVEVIRGGQNVLYGDRALSGVIKIKTRRGEESGIWLQGEAGTHHYRSGAASFGAAAGNVEATVGANAYRDRGWRDHSESDAVNLNAGATWYVSDADTLTFRASGGQSHMQFPGPLTYETMKKHPDRSGNLGDEFNDQWSGRATLLYETVRDWGAARLNAGASYCLRKPELSGLYFRNRLSGYSLAPRVRLGSEENFAMIGADLLYETLKQDNYWDEERRVRESWAELDRLSAAPYLFGRRELPARFAASAGGRWEGAATDNRYVQYKHNQLLPNIGPFPNPNYKHPPDVDPAASYDGTIRKQGWAAETTLSWRPVDETEFWCGYDRVYRYPTLDETASYQGYPLSDPLNENLDPERGNNYEIGAKYEDDRWMLSLTGFLLTLGNEIVYDDTQKLNRNLGETKREGCEAAVVWTAGRYGASTRWSFVNARLKDGENKGKRVPLAPRANGSVSLWVEPIPRLRLSFFYSYVSARYQGNDEANRRRKLDDFGLFGLGAQLSLSADATLYANVDNLLNETYATTAYSGAYYPGEGRGFRLGFRLKY